MIIEPTPTTPRSPVRRALRMAGLVLPVVLFAGVAGIGLLGPKPEAPAPIDSAPPLGAVATSPLASPGAPAEATPVGPAGDPRTPTAIADLPVRSVSATLAARSPGRRGSSVVAVAGYLRGTGGGQACPVATGLPGSACAREVVIADTMGGSSGGPGFGGFGAHIHAVIPPGLVLPGDAGGPGPAPGGDGDDNDPIVVVIGRFGVSDPGCTPERRGCADPFTVERVAWADGESVAVVPGAQSSLVVNPTDPVVADTRQATRAALGPTTTLLRVLLLGAGLEVVDPTAAAFVAEWSAGPEGGSIWYIRALDVPAGPLPGAFKGLRMPQIRWAVVSQRTGALVASGVVPGTATASTSTGGG